ncbi:hypothetical protein PM082_012484 [Marasmius tenuissimus]|nr:hypothetical protein PM082_012484 [Marasmius tenuissimus]
MLSTLMFKHKVNPNSSPSDLGEDLQPLLILGLGCLDPTLGDPASVIMTLNYRILKIILKVYPCFSRGDDSTKSQALGSRFADFTIPILSQISRLMSRPDAVFAFISTIKKLGYLDGLKNKLPLKSPSLWKSWKGVKGEYVLLWDIRRNLRERGMVVRTNEDGCPFVIKYTTRSKLRPSNVVRRYKNAGSSVLAVIRSPIVRMNAKGHLGDNTGSSANVWHTIGRLVPAHTDTIFFEALLVYFVEHHSDVIRNKVDHYVSRPTSPKPSREQQLILEGEKTPIIYVNFDTPAIPTPEACIRILDLMTVSTLTTPSISLLWLRACADSWNLVSPRDDERFDRGGCGVPNKRE